MDKTSLRAAVRASRAARTPADRMSGRAAVRRHVLDKLPSLSLPSGCRVAGYEPLASEPGSTELLAALHAAGHEVIVPITLPDRDLDWRPWLPVGEVDTPALGLDAIDSARLILVPAFAVDQDGHRLGRGGGSYDRALGRASQDAVVVALLFDGELIDQVPTDPWDRPVAAVATPRSWQDLTPSGRGNS